jgi:hypothetical protein
MSEQQIVMALWVLYLNTVVGRLAYVLGKDRGADEERRFRKSLLGVGTIWRVGDDGRLYQVKEDA